MRNLFNLFGLGKAYPLFEVLCELFTFLYNITAGILAFFIRILKAIFTAKEKPLMINGEIVEPPAGK